MRLLKSKEVVGVDVGTSAVKIVELKETSKGFQLENFAVGAIPPQAIVDGAIMDAGAIVDTVMGLIREYKVKRKQACMGLSGHSVIVKEDQPSRHVGGRAGRIDPLGSGTVHSF